MHTVEILETLLWEPQSGYQLREQHLQRAAHTAKALGYLGFDHRLVEQTLESAQRSFDRDQPQKVRICISAANKISVAADPITAVPINPYVVLDTAPIEVIDQFIVNKTTQRDRYKQAQESDREAYDVILWNSHNEITESTRFNVVLKLAGRYLTPPLSAGLLNGCLRQELLNDKIVSEQTIRIEDLDKASEIYLINSVRGWVQVKYVHRGT